MNVSELFIEKNSSIKNSIKKLDKTGKKILLVIDKSKHLIGVVTDGDVRRWILNNGSLKEKVEKIMNKNPITIFTDEKNKAKKIMKKELIEAIPVIDKSNKVKSIIFWHEEFDVEFDHFDRLNNKVVIMAGGKGTRLYPYTKILPKPLIPIGEIPIIERIMNRFKKYGCSEFYITLNYKKEMIKSYFKENKEVYNIKYFDEKKPLGTAGSLYFLKEKIDKTFFLSNCDILIDANYSSILKHHKEENNDMTLVTSLIHYRIPYGIVELNENKTLKKIREKPEYDFLVNTGMYILEPKVLSLVPENELFHMTDLIRKSKKKKMKIGIYPISQKSLMDMGQIEEMEKMMERLGVEKF